MSQVDKGEFNKIKVRTGKHGKNMHIDLGHSLLLEERATLICQLYLQGMTQSQIAAEMDLSQATISVTIRKIREAWQKKRLDDYQEYLFKELGKLDLIEKEAWEAWQRSIGTTQRKVTKTFPGGEIETTVTEDQLPGDPRFLTAVNSTIDRRIRLLGLDAPEEHIVHSAEGRITELIRDGKITFDMLSNEVGKDQARRYFNLAGMVIPDIVEGDIVE